MGKRPDNKALRIASAQRDVELSARIAPAVESRMKAAEEGEEADRIIPAEDEAPAKGRLF